MNAMPSLPTLPGPPTVPVASPPPAPSNGQAPAEPDTGFADALQLARRQAARARENNAQKGAGKPAAKDGAAEPPLAPRAPGRTEAPTETTRTDGATAEATARPGEAATDGSGLPAWLAQALSRHPSAPDDAAATDLARDAQAGLAGTDKGRVDNRPGRAEPEEERSDGLVASDPPATRPAARTGGTAVAAAAAALASQEDAAEARDRSQPGAEPAAGARPETAATAAPAAPVTPTAAPAGTPTGGFSLPATADAAPVDRPIAPPVASPAFAPALGAELTLLVKEGVTEARLHLNPAEMGPITVQIVVEGHTARVEMAADNAATRQALEQAMPALAGALREDGLTLTGGGVFEQARQPRQGQDGQPTGRPGQTAAATGGPSGPEAVPADALARPVSVAPGRLDIYA